MLFLLQHPFFLPLLLLFSSFLYPSLHYMCEYYRKKTKLPPGSFGWCPLLGDTLDFIKPHASFSKGQFLQRNIKRHGNFFRAHLFGHPTIVSCDAELNHFILQNDDRLFEAGYPTNIPGVLGDLTMLYVTGDVHKRIRGVALSFFVSMRDHNSTFLSDIEDNVIKVMESWKGKDTLIFCSETRKFTFSVIVKKILSLEAEDPYTTEILENFKTFMNGLVSVPINFPGTPYNKAIKARHRIREIISEIRGKREKIDRRRDLNGRMDFLDLLTAQDQNVTEEEISSVVLDLLLGGYETTAMLIAIIVKFLAEKSSSDILEDLKEEHLKFVRSRNGEEKLGWDDYKKMELTQCVINEALRLTNVVKFVHRKSIKPIEYKGYEIPAGWRFLPIFTGVHLDPSLHQDPYKFDPRRWQKVDATTSRNFMPFGGGKRLCPGSEFSRIETTFFLHHLVLNFSWTPLVDSDWPLSHPYLDFKHGLQVAIRPLAPPPGENQTRPTMT